MPDYIEYLNLPTAVVTALAVLFLVLQVVGKILELKGKAAPEFMRITKYFKRKKQERKDTREALALMPEVKKTLADVNSHYSADNITKRDNWMHDVDHKQEQDHAWITKLAETLDDIKADLLSIRIEDMRSEIIGFASYVADCKNPVTREQFNRIFKRHAQYEVILEDNEMTNGETNTAMQIIRESYEHHTKHHSFIEDARGYGPIGI